MTCRHLAVLVSLTLAHCTAASAAGAETTKHVLFIAGAPSHGYGSHEHYAGCRLLARTMDESGLDVATNVVRGWPADAELVEQADSIVIYCDGGGRHLLLEHVDAMQQQIDRGVGFVCIHYAVEVPKGAPGNHFLNWLGGYFEAHWSVNPHWTADFTALPKHPITHGVAPFSSLDEWYFHMRFQPEMQGVTPILTAVAPPQTMSRRDGPHSGNPDVRKAVAAGIPQHVAWAYERADGGRSFGITGGHFHWNWAREPMRRVTTNAILWTAGVPVPDAGVTSPSLDIPTLEENQDEEKPDGFDPESIRRQFKIGLLGAQ